MKHIHCKGCLLFSELRYSNSYQKWQYTRDRLNRKAANWWYKMNSIKKGGSHAK